MDVIHHDAEVIRIRRPFYRYRNSFVAPLKHMARAFVATIPRLAKTTEQPFHPRYQIRFRPFQQKMVVIAHQHPGMHPPTVAFASTVDPLEKEQMIGSNEKEFFTPSPRAIM